jgi:uncharacterized protein (DUF433 family)
VAELLDRPVYVMHQVDHLLSLPSGTARRWIDGYERSHKHYKPVIREETTGDETVTWGEFVEAKLLAAYRDKGVPMLHMRPAVERMREWLQVKYPLAHVRPFAAGKELMYQIQDEIGLDKPLRIVVARSNQYVLTSASSSFMDTVESDNDLIVRVRPLGHHSPVVIDPLRQFGSPVVRSVPTEVIAEQFRSGDPASMIGELYELSTEYVEAALRYELALVAA